MHDIVQCIKANLSLTDVGMTVLVGSTWIFAVIYMKDSNLIFSENPVKLFYDRIKIVYDIITGIMGVTSVKADTQPFRV